MSGTVENCIESESKIICSQQILFREIPILAHTHHVKAEEAGASSEKESAYDLEGLTTSTLRSNGCAAGVGVEDVYRASVWVAWISL